jgi:hypothetical protein
MVPTAELAEALGGLGYRGLRVVGRGVNPEVFTPQRRSPELRAPWGADEDTPVALCVSRFAPGEELSTGDSRAFEAMRRVRPTPRWCWSATDRSAEELRAGATSAT